MNTLAFLSEKSKLEIVRSEITDLLLVAKQIACSQAKPELNDKQILELTIKAVSSVFKMLAKDKETAALVKRIENALKEDLP